MGEQKKPRIMLRGIDAVAATILSEEAVTVAVIEDSRRLGGALTFSPSLS